MKKKLVCKKWIAFLLSFILVVCSLPINTIALESNTPIDSKTTCGSSELIADSQEHTEDEVIGEIVEITSLREENVKHFRLADGTYEAVVYTHPVHRKDENGVWQDIDNTLSLVDDGDSQKFQTPDSRIKFTNSFKANEELFTLSENGYSISMMLVSNNTSPNKLSLTTELQPGTEFKPTVNNAPKRTAIKSFDSIDDAATIDNRSSIVYNGVKTNTAIEYVLQGNDLKENIIVSAPCESYEYQFQMDLIGLRAELDNKGNIKLYDLQNGQSRYIIPAPYMYDNNGEYSTAVNYELDFIGNGVYLLTVSADSNWINENDRAFPVTIDPSITLNRVVWDSYTYLSYPNDNYGFDEDLWISNYRTSYIRMNLPDLPSGATFNYAYLYVSYYYHVTDGSLLAGAYQVLEDCKEGEITYNNSPSVSTTRLGTAVLSASSSVTKTTPGTVSFYITSAVRDWYDDSSTNFGIAIKRESSTVHTNASVILKSYEAGNDYAYISVNYTYHIPNGVYAFQNDGSSTRWMTVEDDSVWAGNHIQQAYSASSPASTSVFDRSSLFKISRVSGTTRYIIRSMLNNNLSFGISGTEVITKEIPSADDDVALSDTFYIEWDGSGFLIRPYGSSNVIRMGSTSTANLTTVAKTSATSSARWNLVQYTGAHKRGSIIYHPVTLNAGTTVTFTPVIWATNIDYNTPYLSVTSGYTDKATATWNTSMRQGSFMLHDDGSLKVTSKIYNGSQSSSYSFTHTLTLTLVVDEGIYFFKNKEVGKYVQIDNNASPQYDESDTKMELWDYDGGDYQKWQLIHISDGYYKILSVKSGMALCVPDELTNDDEVELIQQSYSNLSSKQWKVTKSSSGAYILRPKSGESYDTDWCMCAGDQFLWITDGLNVEQGKYVNNDSYKDEWILELSRDSNDSALIALPESYDRSSFFATAIDYLENIGYTDNYNNHATVSEGMSQNAFLEHLRCSKITLVRTHGSKSSISLTGDSLTRNELLALPSDTLAYSELIIYGACLTASGGESGANLVSATVSAGARTVIGFENSVYSGACNRWCTKFFEYYSLYYNNESKTIYDVCYDTDTYMQSDSYYERIDEDGTLISLANYVIVGEQTFP